MALMNDHEKRVRAHHPRRGAAEVLKFIGPGLLVTVGFIDPGNWASNVAAGSYFGYALLWVITLGTIMLILLQHNAAHLGIVSGLCLSEAAAAHLPHLTGRLFLGSGVLATVATALAEVLGAAIGLQMLFHIPLTIGAAMTAAAVLVVLFTNSYRRIERYVIGLVSLIGLAFLYELYLVDVPWATVVTSWVTPSIPRGALPITIAVLGAVVMPHNLFLHSEIIQSRQWNLMNEGTIKRQLRYEFLDTLLAMGVGWAINSAMIIVAAALFFTHGLKVTELPQAQQLLHPLLGHAAALVFAIALLLSGFASSVTAGMAGATIWAGLYNEPFDLQDIHSRTGVLVTLLPAVALVFLLRDPFQGLIWSQVGLSVQLPATIAVLILLTSSAKVMGSYKNTLTTKITLWTTAAIVTVLDVALLVYLTTP
jgi:manganese transport protein